MDFSSDVAFVTGGGSGIGRATCRLLASRGATLVVVDKNKMTADETVDSLDGGERGHYAVALDVRDRAAVAAAFEEVERRLGHAPGVVVNCAGVMLVQPLAELTPDTLDRLLDVNVKGTVWVTQAACERLSSSGRPGSVVSVASMAARGYAQLAAYSLTKGAVRTFCAAAAKEYGPKGIRVNVVSPGLVYTAMKDDFPDPMNAKYEEQNPLGRGAQPEEVAEVIAFLASGQSSYVNGANVCVNGAHV